MIAENPMEARGNLLFLFALVPLRAPTKVRATCATRAAQRTAFTTRGL